MTEVMDAYDGLLAIARQGRAFRYDEVYGPPYTHEKPDRRFGSGFDFEMFVEVPDIFEGQNVEATVVLRVINTSQESLFLRCRLTWIASDGKSYQSSAVYDISRDAAGQLALEVKEADRLVSQDDFPEGEDQEALERMLATMLELDTEAEAYKAVWHQSVTGADENEVATDEELDRCNEYHAMVIVHLQDAGIDVACMLSDSEAGEVLPEELGKLYDWVKTRPEVAHL